MIEDDIVFSYGKDEELPEITIRKKSKIKKNKTSNVMVTMLIEEGKRVSWVYLLSLIIYFSAVALELYFFLSKDPEVVSTSYQVEVYEKMTYEAYIIRSLLTIKSLYIGIGILLIIAALTSLMLWRKGKISDSERYKTSFSEVKERKVLYTIRFFIAFLGYLFFIGGYFVLLYSMNYLSLKGMDNKDIIQYSLLLIGGYYAIPVVYLYRYIIVAAVLAIISLLFLAVIAKIHKDYKVFTSAIMGFPILGGIGFILYKNNLLYYSEKIIILMITFLVFFLGTVYLTIKLFSKISMKSGDII